MRIIKNIIIVLCALVLLTAMTVFFLDRPVTYLLSRVYNLEITYKSYSLNISRGIVFKDFSAVSKDSGVGISCDVAAIRPSFEAKKLILNLNLDLVNFIKKAEYEPARYDTITEVVLSPFSSAWKYRVVKGVLEPRARGVKIRSLEAVSDAIKVRLSGDFENNRIVESDIVIYFSPQMVEKLPPELAGMALTDDEGGWRSLSVRLTGDFSKPSIQISSKSFRLKINAVEVQ